MKNGNTSRLGFTLIELLVVVLIIGILAAVALPQYQQAVLKSRLVQAQSITKTVQDAQHAYYLANGNYATDISALDVDFGKEGSDFYLNNFSCTIEWDRVYCKSIKPIITFHRYYDSDKQMCCSYQKDDFGGDNLCRSLLNTDHWTNGCSEAEVCRCYKQ